MAQAVFSGNTKEKTRVRHRNYCFTWNNYADSDIPIATKWLGTESEYIFQEETGASGTRHLQGAVFFKNPWDFAVVKKCMPKCHIEVCKNKKAAIAYCSKTETRTGKIYTNLKIREPVRDPLENCTLKEWQQNILDIIKTEPDLRKIYWFWEPEGNTGKSCFAKHLCLKHGAVIASGKGADIKYCVAQLHEERDVKIIIMDVPRVSKDFISYQAIEEIKNGLFFCPKYESKQVIMNSPHIFVFANFPPETSTMSKDRWVICRI